MEATLVPAPTAKKRPWLGLAITALPALFLVFDSAIKLASIGPVVEAFQQLGYPVELAPKLGLLQLGCLAVYLVPRTAPLGAVLLTGFLGGAVAAHVRIGSPLLSHTLFPVYIAALFWAGLALRDERLRALARP